MTYTDEITKLTILDEKGEEWHSMLYTGIILNKKEILKFLTYAINDIDERKCFKDLVNRNFYIQESFINMSSDLASALF